MNVKVVNVRVSIKFRAAKFKNCSFTKPLFRFCFVTHFFMQMFAAYNKIKIIPAKFDHTKNKSDILSLHGLMLIYTVPNTEKPQ